MSCFDWLKAEKSCHWECHVYIPFRHPDSRLHSISQSTFNLVVVKVITGFSSLVFTILTVSIFLPVRTGLPVRHPWWVPYCHVCRKSWATDSSCKGKLWRALTTAVWQIQMRVLFLKHSDSLFSHKMPSLCLSNRNRLSNMCKIFFFRCYSILRSNRKSFWGQQSCNWYVQQLGHFVSTSSDIRNSPYLETSGDLVFYPSLFFPQWYYSTNTNSSWTMNSNK